MHKLLRDNSEDTLFREDYSFLITLCQKATLLPRSFFCSEKLEFGTDTPVDAGASATIYRGFLGAAEVAVKSFRLYYRTINQVKKVIVVHNLTICIFECIFSVSSERL
jgi:hypothetical protein